MEFRWIMKLHKSSFECISYDALFTVDKVNFISKLHVVKPNPLMRGTCVILRGALNRYMENENVSSCYQRGWHPDFNKTVMTHVQNYKQLLTSRLGHGHKVMFKLRI